MTFWPYSRSITYLHDSLLFFWLIWSFFSPLNYWGYISLISRSPKPSTAPGTQRAFDTCFINECTSGCNNHLISGPQIFYLYPKSWLPRVHQTSLTKSKLSVSSCPAPLTSNLFLCAVPISVQNITKFPALTTACDSNLQKSLNALLPPSPLTQPWSSLHLQHHHHPLPPPVSLPLIWNCLLLARHCAKSAHI